MVRTPRQQAALRALPCPKRRQCLQSYPSDRFLPLHTTADAHQLWPGRLQQFRVVSRLAPALLERKKIFCGGGIFCWNLLGKKQKTTTGPDFVREDFIPKDDCEEMQEECEMNRGNGENALTSKSARASLCGGANKARKKRVVDLGGMAVAYRTPSAESVLRKRLAFRSGC